MYFEYTDKSRNVTLNFKWNLFIYFISMTDHLHFQRNITAGQQGTNKWTLTVAQLTHKKTKTKTPQICRQINVFKGLAETSLRTKADRVRQGIPDIDNPARKNVLANTLSTPCLVQLELHVGIFSKFVLEFSMASSLSVWLMFQRSVLRTSVNRRRHEFTESCVAVTTFKTK